MSSPAFHPYRFVSLIITAFGAFTSSVLALQLLAAWLNLRWEPESEWETSGGNWRFNSVKIIWVLLSVYFAAAAAVYVIGFCGIIKNKMSFIRFYRDYSIADFSFCAFVTTIAIYSIFHSSTRAGICEELSHHPELMHDMTELGLNLENCERWLERFILAFVALLFIIIIVRLHSLVAVSNLYAQLRRYQFTASHVHSHRCFDTKSSSRRIFIIPPGDQSASATDVELVYAPVPLASLPENVQKFATEAWVSKGDPRLRRPSRQSLDQSRKYYFYEQAQQRQQPHSDYRHHRRHSSSSSCCPHRHLSARSRSVTRTGTIRLPVIPGEGLLPYRASPGAKV